MLPSHFIYFSKLKTVLVTHTSGFSNKINFVEVFIFKQSNSNDKQYSTAQGRCADRKRQLPVGCTLGELTQSEGPLRPHVTALLPGKVVLLLDQ